MSAPVPGMKPPIDPPLKPYSVSVAASGILEALSEKVAIGVPQAGLVTKVHVQLWDAVSLGQPLFTLDNRELAAELTVNEGPSRPMEAWKERIGGGERPAALGAGESSDTDDATVVVWAVPASG